MAIRTGSRFESSAQKTMCGVLQKKRTARPASRTAVDQIKNCGVFFVFVFGLCCSGYMDVTKLNLPNLGRSSFKRRANLP